MIDQQEPVTVSEPQAVGADIVAIASIVHEANRAYCATLGDFSQLSWENAPSWQRASAIAGVQAVIDGTARTPEEQHQAWLDFKAAAGWVYGPVKGEGLKTHPCMVPYADLPAEQRKKDVLFRAIVAAMLEVE